MCETLKCERIAAANTHPHLFCVTFGRSNDISFIYFPVQIGVVRRPLSDLGK